MKLILITSNGVGAGKTTFAGKLGGTIVRLGEGLRQVAATECISQEHSDWVLDSYTQESKQKLVAIRSEQDSEVISVRNLLIRTAQKMGDYQMVKHWCRNLLHSCAMSSPIEEMTSVIVVDDIRSVNQLLLLKDRAHVFNAETVHLHLEARGVSVLPDLNYEEEVARLKNMCDYLIVRDDRPISVSGTGDFSSAQLRWVGSL